MGRRFVDAIWIRQRMNLRDARVQAEARRRVPAILQAERVPFVEVEIVRVPADPNAPIVEITLVPKKVDGDQ